MSVMQHHASCRRDYSKRTSFQSLPFGIANGVFVRFGTHLGPANGPFDHSSHRGHSGRSMWGTQWRRALRSMVPSVQVYPGSSKHSIRVAWRNMVGVFRIRNHSFCGFVE